MAKTLSIQSALILTIATLCTQTLWANTGLTAAEADTIVKEDVASAQVMAEICPNLVGQNAALSDKIKTISSSYLVDLSDKSMTLEKLQSDAEFVEILKEARADAKSTSADEQKEVCTELLSM